MKKYTPQVKKEHYDTGSYRVKDRWNSYWHQLSIVRAQKPHTVLEVGVGDGVVMRELRSKNIKVTTFDIAQDLKPDIVGSVTKIPLPENSVDLVLVAEVIEHIRFEDVPTALGELSRVARNHVVISVPHPGYVFMLSFKLPLLPHITFFAKIPFFWRGHHFDGQHYWELGKRGYSLRRFTSLAKEAGLFLEWHKCYADDPAHRYFLFST